MRAWYDILATSLAAREDEAGVLDSCQSIQNVIAEQIASGLSEKQIWLVGFSQGGAMALYTALQHKGTLGGVVALSAYLPLIHNLNSNLSKTTPMFLAAGQQDTVVLPEWTQKSHQALKTFGYKCVSYQEYAMAHAVCMDELSALNAWMNQLLVEEDLSCL